MNFDFDYRKFQNEAQDNLAKIFAESIIEQESVDQQMVDETYSKIKRILNCPEMEKCYPYLYSLDFEHVNEEDKQKVDKLYECGLQRGVITEDEDGETDNVLEDEDDVNGDVTDGDIETKDNGSLCGGPDDSITDIKSMETVPQKPVGFEKPCYTVLYSANKDGEIKLGEFYSSAKTTLDARQDCEMRLSEAGYSAIEILAIERSRYGENDELDRYSSDDYHVYGEDDSEEYEKQETGDNSSSEDSSTDVPSDADEKSTEDNAEQSDGNEESEEGEEDKIEDNAEENGEEPVENTKDDENTDDSDSSEESAEDDTEDGDTENKTEDGDSESNSDSSEDNEEKDDADGFEDEDNSEDDEEDKEDDGEDEEKKLTADEKNILKDEYTKIFKDVLKKQKLDKCVDDMELGERVEFWKAISDKWSKNDPSEFLSDKDQEKLNKTVVKSEEDGENKKDS